MSIYKSSVECTHGKGFNCNYCWPKPTLYHFKIDLGSRSFVHTIKAFNYDQARNIVYNHYPLSAMIAPI